MRRIFSNTPSLLVLVLAVVLANSLISYFNIRQIIENESWVSHTHEVLQELEATVSRLSDVESQLRGFVISGNSDFMDPYDKSVELVNGHIRRLQFLTSDNERQIANIKKFETLVGKKFETVHKTLELAKPENGGLPAAQDYVGKEDGRLAMQAVQDQIKFMESEEQQLLIDRAGQSARSILIAIGSLVLATLLAMAFVGLAYWLINRNLFERRLNEQRLTEARDQLEIRVRERTAELASTNIALQDEVVVRQRTAEQLSLSATELERSNAALQDFASVASHDLQEPLRKIQAFGDRLRQKSADSLDEQSRDYIDRMQKSAKRMQTLINDLLMFSRVTTKGQAFVSVNLNQIASEVVSDLEVRIQQSGGQVEVVNLPTLEADPLQMRQLLQNLLGNALKFQRPGVPPVVRISCDALPSGNGHSPTAPESGRMYRIQVADNGIGFDVKYLDRIFTVFQRLHGRDEYEGTGMGLAICRKIAERHGGSITAQSEPQHGSTFEVILPERQRKGVPVS